MLPKEPQETTKSLISETKYFASEKQSLSWLYSLSTIIMLGVTFAGSIFIPVLGVKIVLALLTAVLQIRMFVIYHDNQHHAILHRSGIANFIFTVYGIFSLAPSSIWKRSHDYHHKHNSKPFSASIGSYPVMTKKKFQTSSTNEQIKYLVTRHPLTIALGYFSMFIWGMCITSFTSNPRKHWDSLLSLFVHAGIYFILVLFFGWSTALLSVTLPCLLAFGMGAYLFYVQHNFPGVVFFDNQGWSYEGAALESSSYLKMNPFLQWTTANIGFHHIHHLNARIPFYRLPEAFKAVPQFREVKTITFRFRDIVACLKLKFWDSETGQMVGRN